MKFQFRILTGQTEDECKAKYDALADETTHLHDPYTFYLFDQGGVGYLGDTALFGGDAAKFNMLGSNATYDDLKPDSFYFITANCTITDGLDPVVDSHTCTAGSIWITNSSCVPSEISWTNFTTYMARYITASAIKAADISDATYTGNETSVMTSAAVKKLIDENINAQDLLQIAFFSNVSDVITLTATDITNEYVEVEFDGETYQAPVDPNVDHAGDLGLVFQIRYGDEYDETDSDGDNCRFVNLHGLINLYVADPAALTTVMTIDNDSADHTKKIKVEVNKSTVTTAQWEELIMNAIDTVSDYIDDSTHNTDYDPTAAGGDNLSPNKFISESQLADILAHVLINFTQVVWGGADPMEEEEEELP